MAGALNLDQYSRPATVEDLKDLVRRLNEAEVAYLLIGGYGLYARQVLTKPFAAINCC